MERLLECEDIINNCLSTEQIQRWKEHGCLLVNGLLPNELIEKAATDVLNEVNSSPSSNSQDFGSDGKMEFPCSIKSLNEITLHKNIINTVKQLLCNDNNWKQMKIRLTQSDTWPKYGKKESRDEYDNRDQRIHCDYPNHTLVHPPSWYEPEAVAIIVYFSDKVNCEGATAVIPRKDENDEAYKFPLINLPGMGAIPWMNDKTFVENYFKENHPEIYSFRQKLYERELKANYKKGSILLYRHDIWHRGTPVKENICRIAQNIVYKKAECEWLTNWNYGWSRNMYRKDQLLEKLIASLSVDQRNCLGFPSPDSSYWNEKTIEYIKARYECFGMDITPYLKTINS